ncbi:hypothetical protein AM377_02550 [Serratia marcescens]|nr:hypothetical protein AM377_02550 [Serratia marcescens]
MPTSSCPEAKSLSLSVSSEAWEKVVDLYYISRRFFSLTIEILSCVYIPVPSAIPAHYAGDVRCNN